MDTPRADSSAGNVVQFDVKRPPVKAGDTVFIVGQIVSIEAENGIILRGVTVRLPVRWAKDGSQQITVPISAIALP